MSRFFTVSLFIFACFNWVKANDNATALADSVCKGDSTISFDYRKERKPFGFFKILKKVLEVDTNYIETDKYNITLKTQSDWRYKLIWLKGSSEEGRRQSLYFSPRSQVIIGPYVSCSLFSLGWTFDIGTKLTTNNSNIYLSLYAPMFGVDYYYENDVNGYRIQKIRGFNDDITKQCKDVTFPGLSSDMVYLHAYYILNYRHFSYPAAYSHSSVQRRTSGGFILGYSYSRQVVNFDYEQLPPPFHDETGDVIINDALKVKEIHYINHSLSVGYSFNWVFARNFLFNMTASPAMGYNFTRGEKPTSDKLYKLKNLNFDFVGKTAFVWNTNHMFAGGSFTAHTYAYKKSTFSCQNALFSAQLYFGINLWRKKSKTNKSY